MGQLRSQQNSMVKDELREMLLTREEFFVTSGEGSGESRELTLQTGKMQHYKR